MTHDDSAKLITTAEWSEMISHACMHAYLLSHVMVLNMKIDNRDNIYIYIYTFGKYIVDSTYNSHVESQ